ncbi:VWA domain-containing protein [Haloferula chungangensis]|uniref:VWA domain-containing protein n=1 Tax=Haloferula chungangensis TaxID=1048331 RepID=A0ABW2L6D4_9BACT
MRTHRLIRSVLLLLAMSLPAHSASGPSTTNIIVFDASGSMWNKMQNATRIEIAREVMEQFLDGYDTSQALGVIAYGHRKRGDCDDIEVLVEPSNIDPKAVSKQIHSLLPKGKTPLAESLRMAGGLIPKTAEEANILLITDGLETCDGDPCAVAKELIAKGIKVRAHVVGFGLTKAEADSLSCIAALTGGKIFNPSNGEELLNALKQSVKIQAAAAPAEEEPIDELSFPTTLNLRNIGFGLPAGFMKWSATDESGKVRELGLHQGSGLITQLPKGTWTIVAEGPEGRGEGVAKVTGPEGRPYIDFTAAQVAAEITNSAPLTAGVSAYISFRIDTPPPGNPQSQFKIGIFPKDDPLTRIISSGQNRYVFAGRKVTPGKHHAAVLMPKQPGVYKLAFLRSGEPRWTVIAEKEIEVVAVPDLKLEVPPRVVAGSVLEPTITSGAGGNDRLVLFALNPDGSRGRQVSSVAYSDHIQKNEGLIDAPAEPGKYQLVLIARTADSKNAPEATAEVVVVSGEDFTSAPSANRSMPGAGDRPADGEVSVSLMLDGDAEMALRRQLMWTLRPVVRDESGKWIYDPAVPFSSAKSKMLDQQETLWNLAPGVWEVSVLVADNQLNRVLVEIDPAAKEHAFAIPAEKLPKPASGQPTQWLVSAEGGEPVLTTTATPDPKTKALVHLALPGVAADAAVTWMVNPLDADGTTLSRDGRMGGGGNLIGGERTMELAPGKWKLTAKSGTAEYLLVADVESGKADQSFTLDRRYGSGDVRMEVAEKLEFLAGGYFPISLKVPDDFKGKVRIHTGADQDQPAVFETEAAELAAATDPVLPMPEKPGNYELQIRDNTGNLLLAIPFTLSAGKQDAAVKNDGEPQLRQFQGNISGTGSIDVEIAGRKEEFVTTRQIQRSSPAKADSPEVQQFLNAVEGKVINTAVLRAIAGNCYVSLTAYGSIGEKGPAMMGESRTSFEVQFALDPKTLTLKPGSRSLRYDPPGSSHSNTFHASDYELELESATALPSGELALKGHFSGTLDEDIKGGKLDKFMPVKGTFDILAASGDDAVGNLLKKK